MPRLTWLLGVVSMGLCSQALAATGSISLIDKTGLKWFINENITFSTTSSASAAMSEASYTQSVQVTTASGGNTSSTLNDLFDGFNTICLSLNHTFANCNTGNANFVIYNQTGAPAVASCDSPQGKRQYTFPKKAIGDITVWRSVFVPHDDSFARHLNYFQNTGAAPVSVTMIQSNNLGSDANTKITGSSSNDLTVTKDDTWATSFQQFSGVSSSDPRFAVVFGTPNATVPLLGVNFVDGDDNPYWGYTFTVAPGETSIIMSLVAGTPSIAASKAAAKRLLDAGKDAATYAAVTRCIEPDDLLRIQNFSITGCAVGKDGSPCDDGNKCTVNDSCVSGFCVGAPKRCRDPNSTSCTGVCNADTGACDATAVADMSACSDGDACTHNDACQAGACVPGAKICQSCEGDADCDDHNVCNGTEACVGRVCAGGQALYCDDGNASTIDRCDTASGCQHSPLAQGTPAREATVLISGKGCNATPAPFVWLAVAAFGVWRSRRRSF